MKKRDKTLNTFILILVICFLLLYFSDKDSPLIKNDTIKKRETPEVNETIKEYENDLNVYFLDVGQADAILIENFGSYALIDAGNNSDGNRLVSYFKDMGIKGFKHVVATHAHEDHIGGMDEIINNFKISNFYMPEYLTTTKTFEDVLDAIDTNNLEITVPRVGEVFYLNDAKIEVVHAEEDPKDINDSSIVLRLIYGANSILFMGDASTRVEKQLLDRNISSDVLKLGHHGSKYSSMPEFLDAVSPIYAIISVGKNNKYNHPHQVTLDKLKNRNIKIYRTDEDGTIKLTSNGNFINFELLDTDLDG